MVPVVRDSKLIHSTIAVFVCWVPPGTTEFLFNPELGLALEIRVGEFVGEIEVFGVCWRLPILMSIVAIARMPTVPATTVIKLPGFGGFIFFL